MLTDTRKKSLYRDIYCYRDIKFVIVDIRFWSYRPPLIYIYTFTFTFMHLADAFIQSDLQLHSGYTFSLVCVPWEYIIYQL